jgi:hypothetical protein
MAKKKKSVLKTKEKPEIEGFDIKINEFGELVKNYSVNDLNEFLNENTEDKKLKDKN